MTLATITSSQTWTVPAGVTSVSVLVVGGGGGGCGPQSASTGGTGSGGGAGGAVYVANYGVTAGSGITVTIGNGGASGGVTNGLPASPGGNTVFDLITALGGGPGNGYPGDALGKSGGCGGGGPGTTGINAGGAATQGSSGGGTGYGNAGGSSTNLSPGFGSGGGGGIGSVGGNATGTAGGAGGDGLIGTFFNANFPSTYYGAGGGGGTHSGTGGAASTSSTGGSSGTASNTTPTSPTANTGNGGGGCGNTGSQVGDGAPGASGVVLIWYTASATPNILNYDFPNPRGHRRSIALLDGTSQPEAVINTLLNVVYPKPFLQSAWPVPKGPRRLVEYPYNNPGVDELTTIIHLDQFYGPPGMGPPNYDWPVPKGPPQLSYINRGMVDNELLKLLEAAVLHNQYDWPVPKGKQYPSDLRTFIQGLNQPIFNNTQFFYAQGEAPRYDYPNPRGKPYPYTLYAEMLRSILSSTPPYSFGLILG